MRDKRTPKDVCGEAKSTLDSLKSVFNTFRRKPKLGAPDLSRNSCIPNAMPTGSTVQICP